MSAVSVLFLESGGNGRALGHDLQSRVSKTERAVGGGCCEAVGLAFRPQIGWIGSVRKGNLRVTCSMADSRNLALMPMRGLIEVSKDITLNEMVSRLLKLKS